MAGLLPLLKISGVLGVLLVLFFSHCWCFRRGLKEGELKGEEKAKNAFDKKLKAMGLRLSDFGDAGFRVREPDTKWGLAPVDPRKRVEPGVSDGGGRPDAGG